MKTKKRILKAYAKKNSLLIISILSLFLFPVRAFADNITFTDPGDKIVNEGELLSVTLTATAIKQVTFSYTPAIPGATITDPTPPGSGGSGDKTHTTTFTWTPTPSQVAN